MVAYQLKKTSQILVKILKNFSVLSFASPFLPKVSFQSIVSPQNYVAKSAVDIKLQSV